MPSAKEIITKLLLDADVQVNGSRPQDIKIHNERLYSRVLSGGSLALGESYMDGWWDANSLDEFFFKILGSGLDIKVVGLKNVIFPYLKAKLLNRQKTYAHHIGAWHYDIGNELYSKMLDKNMQYSCGYWKKAQDLDHAQEDKMDLICRKLELTKGETLLDIGCGWGGLLKYAAEKYGIKGVGITVSKEQAAYARKSCEGLPVEIKIEDYRKVSGLFDKIVSVGMIEHVGFKNYKDYMKIVHRCLKDNGIFLLHTIGSNKTTKGAGDPWIDRYIFPDGKLPSIAQLTQASEKLFVMEDWHNFGAYYDKTLIAWRENFIKSWPELKNRYDERFYRMWIYYLSCCAGSFRTRYIQLWQIVYTKKGLIGGYERKN
jgi:cyclopropane-fatty-acyl-phospholipid synthase